MGFGGFGLLTFSHLPFSPHPAPWLGVRVPEAQRHHLLMPWTHNQAPCFSLLTWKTGTIITVYLTGVIVAIKCIEQRLSRKDKDNSQAQHLGNQRQLQMGGKWSKKWCNLPHFSQTLSHCSQRDGRLFESRVESLEPDYPGSNPMASTRQQWQNNTYYLSKFLSFPSGKTTVFLCLSCT